MGIDIIDNRRIKNSIDKYGKKFKKRCFTEFEINKSNNIMMSYNSFAKKFAAKEACAKALGTGIGRGIYWKDIEILNNINGKPYIVLYNEALKILKKKSQKKYKIEISLSDEKNYSIANVIIFENEINE